MLAMGEQHWRLGSRPALDGLRAVAVLFVIVDHSFGPRMDAMGSIGVSMFFALSGFLITALLLEEQGRTGQVAMKAFFARRAVRLLPALVFFLVGASVVAVALHDSLIAPRYGVFTGLLYVANWPGAVQNIYLGGLTHLWSLSVEGQFYVAWPLAVLFLRSRRALLSLTAALAGASLLWTVFLAVDWHGNWGRVYNGTDTRASELLVGCLLAIWLCGRPEGAPSPRWTWAPLPLLLCVSFTSGWYALVGAPAVATGAAALMIWACAQGSYRGWLCHRWLRAVGRRSYALYLWNLPLLVFVRFRLDLDGSVSVALMLGATFLMAEVSHRWVEQPVTAWAARRRRAALVPGAARPALGGTVPAVDLA